MKPNKEGKKNEIESNAKGKSNEQVLKEIKRKVWKVVEKKNEKLKFMKIGFNHMNYEAFIEQAKMLKEKLKREGMIPVSEECSTIIKQEVAIPEKMKDLGSCTFP